MDNTEIEWTDATWNPVTGCTKVSPGCDNCYAEALTARFPGRFPNGFDVTLKPHRMNEPAHWQRPRRVFVNSMSDLFHRDIPIPFLSDIWAVMLRESRHTFQVLTKRPHRAMQLMTTYADLFPPAKNIWLGTSVENQRFADNRIPALLDAPRTPGDVRFLSCEPLLGEIDLTPWIDKLDWVIVGGESGRGRRPMLYQDARAIRDVCTAEGVAFFYKQGNGRGPGQDRTLDGRTWDEFPGIDRKLAADR